MASRSLVKMIASVTTVVAVCLALVLFCSSTQAGPQEKIVVSASASEGGPLDIIMMNPDGSGQENLTLDFLQSAGGPKISPDGKWIAFDTAPPRNIWVMKSDGTEKRQLTFLSQPYGPAVNDWLDNDTILYHTGPQAGVQEVWQIDVDGSNDRVCIASPFTDPDDGQPQYAPNLARVSPDGQTILFVAQSGSNSPSQDLYMIDSDCNSNPRSFYKDPGNDHIDDEGVWSRSGDRVYWNRRHAGGVSGAHADIVWKWADNRSGSQTIDGVERVYDGRNVNADAISPDDTRMLLHMWYEGELWARDLVSKNETLLLSGSNVGYADFDLVALEMPCEPPVADAGEDVVAECEADGAAQVCLDGSGSTDPDDDIFIYIWEENAVEIATGETACHTFDLGTHEVDLTVIDDCDLSASNRVSVTVEDTMAPALTLPETPVFVCNSFAPGGVGALAASDPLVQAWLASATATDLCDPLPVVLNDAGGVFTAGMNPVSFTASDSSGNTFHATASVQVVHGFGGFERPLLNDGSASIRQGHGRTIPVKFSLDCGGQAAGAATATIAVFQVLDASTGEVDTIDLAQDAGQSNDNTNVFRFDAVEQHYVYNLSTKGYVAPAMYRIVVTLDDGTEHAVNFLLTP